MRSLRLTAAVVFAVALAASSLGGCGASDPPTDGSNAASNDDAGDTSDSGSASRGDGGAAGDASPLGHSDAGAACTSVPAFTFNVEDAPVITSGDQEFRWLRKTISGVGTIAIHLYSGKAGAFAPATIELACAPGTMCTSGEIETGASFTRAYLVERGTLRIDTLASPDSNEMTGSLSHLRFRALQEVTVDGGRIIETIDPSGACFDVADITIDTRVAVGTPCIDHAQCGRTKVCAVSTGTCALPECTTSCDGGLTCVAARDQAPVARACVRACGNFAPCPNGQACDMHVCKNVPQTAAPLGAACAPRANDVVTQCQAGLVCDRTLGHPNLCLRACNPLAADPGCGGSERCFASGMCAPPDPDALAVAIGADCTLPAAQPNMPAPSVVPCGDDGKGYRGACFKSATIPYAPPPATKCWALCSPLAGPSCAAATQCSSPPVNLETDACQPYF